jgi:lipopolysaccharide/colanic/teichoic acid biosynthesis glycosyltransferase
MKATRAHRQSGVGLIAKQAIDRAGAVIGLVVTAPLQTVVSLAVWASMGRPIFFVQDRPGRGGRVFRLVKFRTMSAERADGSLRPDAERLTRLGRALRATSLDELPQLWNVLRGNLSLVGPRPLLVQYLERYSPEQARRHEVLPGITGWAQVNGRNAITWEEKFALDVWYVDHWSLALDFRIMLITAVRVLRREGVAAEGHVTMAEFTGTSGEGGRG